MLLCWPCSPLAAAGCGGSSKSGFPTIQAARTYALEDSRPSGPCPPGSRSRVSFLIRQPDGTPLTQFKPRPRPAHRRPPDHRAPRPEHDRPPAPADRGGRNDQRARSRSPSPARTASSSTPIRHDTARSATSSSSARCASRASTRRSRCRRSPRPPTSTATASRCTASPSLHAIQAGFLTVTVTDPDGKPARFTPWYGALAHAIFFRQGSLDYFHTHVCAPGASGCTSVLGATQGHRQLVDTREADVGVLVPAPGTWRLFLQCRVDGHVLTAPFTLDVKP